jgi:molybdate transport system ATP-binding protein
MFFRKAACFPISQSAKTCCSDAGLLLVLRQQPSLMMSSICSESAPCSTADPVDCRGGEKQRVAIGRALLAGPRLLLMDEPLASLDARRKDEILPYIERLRDQASVPIVYVSHAVAEVTRLASTIVLISDGRVRAVGPLQEVMGRAELYPMAGRFEAAAVLAVSVAAHDARWGLTELTGALVS